MRMSLSFFAITDTMAQDGFGNFEIKSDINQCVNHKREAFPILICILNIQI